MRIALIDVDGHNFPNLPLMKISAWHKKRGDSVEWYDPLFGGHFDRAYLSKVFTFTPDYQYQIHANEIIKGGTGYYYPDGGQELPPEIEHTYPDYDLYGITDTAFGFLTRGCPRGCDFCIVGKKEGLQSHKVADLTEFWSGQKNIKLLDPNLLACKDWHELMQQLIDSNAWVDFTQGMDIRLMTAEKAAMINKMKIKMVHFAWDNYEFKTYEKLKEYRAAFDLDMRRLRVYVLTNFNTTLEQDLERVYKLRELDYDPYVMVFEKEKAQRKVKQLQRWVNNKRIFRSGGANKFENYNG